MDNRIKELEKMILNSDVKVSDILRHALIVANKHDKDFIPWIKQEMEGYESGKDCPEYREVHGTPIAINDYNQRIPFTIEHTGIREIASKRPIPFLVSALEDMIKNPKDGFLTLPYPESIQDDFSKCIGVSARFSLMVSSYYITTILNNIRTKLLNWVISLNKKEEHSSDTVSSDIIFPPKLISRLPNDIKVLADSFNLNFSHDEADVCMFIMRRMLPLSIVKKFEQIGQEETIKKGNDYMDTMPLLAKAKHLITERRYKEIISYKKFLDASQHSYTFNIDISDVINVATTLRLLFDELFPDDDKK